MSKLKMIEGPKMDLHPQHELTPVNMSEIRGGAGCICDKNPFNLNNGCLCDENKFGICNQVNGGGPGPGNGCKNTSGVVDKICRSLYGY